MFEKQGKFYADWRDRSGKRLRKSFHSAKAALQFEAEQKELAHPKQTAGGTRLPHSYSPKSKQHADLPNGKAPHRYGWFHRASKTQPRAHHRNQRTL
jgi:hypothetical protein